MMVTMTNLSHEGAIAYHRDVVRACDQCAHEVCEQCRIHTDPEQQHEGRKCPDYVKRAVVKERFGTHKTGNDRKGCQIGMRKSGYTRTVTSGLKPTRMAQCHPDRPNEGGGLCKSCYMREFKARKAQKEEATQK